MQKHNIYKPHLFFELILLPRSMLTPLRKLLSLNTEALCYSMLKTFMMLECFMIVLLRRRTTPPTKIRVLPFQWCLLFSYINFSSIVGCLASWLFKCIMLLLHPNCGNPKQYCTRYEPFGSIFWTQFAVEWVWILFVCLGLTFYFILYY